MKYSANTNSVVTRFHTQVKQKIINHEERMKNNKSLVQKLKNILVTRIAIRETFGL